MELESWTIDVVGLFVCELEAGQTDRRTDGMQRRRDGSALCVVIFYTAMQSKCTVAVTVQSF